MAWGWAPAASSRRGEASPRGRRGEVEGHHQVAVGLALEGLQGELQALHLPGEDLLVLRRLGRVLPAPRPGHRHPVHHQGVVLEGVHPRGQGGPEAADGGPPVVVVALEEDLPPGQAGEVQEVRDRLGEAHGPGDVPGDHHQVLLAHHLPPPPEEGLRVPFPARSEDGHGLGVDPGEVGVGDGVDAHGPKIIPWGARLWRTPSAFSPARGTAGRS